jgi:hypothetical protein
MSISLTRLGRIGSSTIEPLGILAKLHCYRVANRLSFKSNQLAMCGMDRPEEQGSTESPNLLRPLK